MRASEIKPGQSYAATGRDLQLSRVLVLSYDTQPDVEKRFHCVVEAGEVYTGWTRSGPGLDMTYAGVGEMVDLASREILRPWSDEQERRNKVRNQRESIRAAMSEMDAVLNQLGLPDAQMQLVQLPYGYLAVTVLGIEDLRRLRDQQEAAPTDPEGVGGVSGPTDPTETGPEVPGSSG